MTRTRAFSLTSGASDDGSISSRARPPGPSSLDRWGPKAASQARTPRWSEVSTSFAYEASSPSSDSLEDGEESAVLDHPPESRQDHRPVHPIRQHVPHGGL